MAPGRFPPPTAPSMPSSVNSLEGSTPPLSPYPAVRFSAFVNLECGRGERHAHDRCRYATYENAKSPKIRRVERARRRSFLAYSPIRWGRSARCSTPMFPGMGFRSRGGGAIAVRNSPSRRVASVRIDWAIGRSPIGAVSNAEPNSAPEQAPQRPSGKPILSRNSPPTSELSPITLVFASDPILLSYASLRFSDLQRRRLFCTNADSHLAVVKISNL